MNLNAVPVNAGAVALTETARRPEPRAEADTSERAAPSTPADPSALKAAVDSGGVQLLSDGRTIEFSIDSDSNRVIIKVKSADTGEVVRQIPPDDYLKLVAQFKELYGVLFDQKA
jgi:flagellar protein FlaG